MEYVFFEMKGSANRYFGRLVCKLRSCCKLVIFRVLSVFPFARTFAPVCQQSMHVRCERVFCLAQAQSRLIVGSLDSTIQHDEQRARKGEV